MVKHHQVVAVKTITHNQWVSGKFKVGDLIWMPEEGVKHLLANRMVRWPESSNPPRVPGKPLRRSEGWPVDSFAVVEREWEGRTVVCIGGGPSTTREDIELLRLARERDEIRVIAVNDMYLVAPWADLLYFADARWWEWHNAGLKKSWPWAAFESVEVSKAFRNFSGQKATVFTASSAVKDIEVFVLHVSEQRRGLSSNPRELVTGGNSGYQAMNLAVLAGADCVLLVGYDMQFTGGKSHSHNGHPARSSELTYAREYARRFDAVAGAMPAGLRILNCTASTAIKAFPRVPLQEALCKLT